jgi:hypothetical protein
MAAINIINKDTAIEYLSASDFEAYHQFVALWNANIATSCDIYNHITWKLNQDPTTSPPFSLFNVIQLFDIRVEIVRLMKVCSNGKSSRIDIL